MNKEYIIYHIPGKKIGVTQNLEARVHTQQGYKPGEYEVLESSDDIDYISRLGYHSALVGTSLMKTGSPGTALAELLNRVPV